MAGSTRIDSAGSFAAAHGQVVGYVLSDNYIVDKQLQFRCPCVIVFRKSSMQKVRKFANIFLDGRGMELYGTVWLQTSREWILPRNLA